jgi:hypothetical protein
LAGSGAQDPDGGMLCQWPPSQRETGGGCAMYDGPMPEIITLAELATFTRSDPEEVAEDPYAAMILELASGLVCDTASHPEWETSGAGGPRAARRICLQVAGRTYTNPDLETSSNTGPIGSRVIDWAAYGLTLTEAEEEELEGLQGIDDAPKTGFWTLALFGSEAERVDTVYLPDSNGAQPIPYLDPSESDALTPVIQ